MYDQRLLPGEQQRDRRRVAVDEATEVTQTPPSVRSIRQRFEAAAPSSTPASAPATPAKKRLLRNNNAPRTQTKTQAQLAAFLKAGSGPDKEKAAKPRAPSKEKTNGSVGSLIEKWSATQPRADRIPLKERDLQKVEDAPKKGFVDSVDTFGSSSADLDQAIPKTDPGPRLQAFAAHLSQGHGKAPALASAADAVATGDQNLRDLVARGIQNSSAKEAGKRSSSSSGSEHAQDPGGASLIDARRRSGPSTPAGRPASNERQCRTATQQGNTAPQNAQGAVQQASKANDSDWGAGDVYIRELFAEAEDTAERAVQCDENEEYFEAFELYWVVVDLYYKVIPFLTPEEGGDVHERIKMYTRRCEAIREAFEDDPEGQDEIEVRIADATLVSAQKEEQIQESFNAGMWNTHAGEVENVEHAEPAFQYAPNRVPLEESPTAVEETGSQWSGENSDVARNGNDNESETSALQKNRFPDYANSKPLSALPEAPRNAAGVTLSASTKAHRSSLSRPISRSAVRASTSSVSRERVAEMQEKVQVMQDCLNNFTVKRKHLGPARALELHVTTLNANTFGDLKKLEPLAPELEHKWATELEVLLSMLQEIKEMRPGVGYGLRDDIAGHLPALERCDRSVRKTMRSFAALAEHVSYVERETATNSAKGGRSRRRWWVKVPVVVKGGLPPDVLRIVEEAEQEMRGVFKVCHEINVEVVKSMPVPPSFVEGLPKHARSLIHRELKEGLTTWGMFKVSDYMKDRNLWNKENAKDITSSLEKVALIWEAKTSNKSFLSRTFDIRGERFHQAMTAFRRCQNAIRDLRREWYVLSATVYFPTVWMSSIRFLTCSSGLLILWVSFCVGLRCSIQILTWRRFNIMRILVMRASKHIRELWSPGHIGC